ncbi:hypothetical protein PAMP_008367 [Pampus punctatissimus]
MDILTAWAVTNPAVVRILWVLVLVLATLLVWFFFFCCYTWNQRSLPSLERYLAVMAKNSKSKAPTQRKKKPKEKSAASVQVEEAVLKESVAPVQGPPGPAVRKRKRRPLKAGMETLTSVTSQKENTDGAAAKSDFLVVVYLRPKTAITVNLDICDVSKPEIQIILSVMFCRIVHTVYHMMFVTF